MEYHCSNFADYFGFFICNGKYGICSCSIWLCCLYLATDHGHIRIPFCRCTHSTLLSTYALFHARRDKKETQKRVDELERNQTARADETKASYEEKVSKLKEEKEQLLQQVRQLERENRNRAASRLTENGEAVRFKNEETY